jgi:L-asparaginase II
MLAASVHRGWDPDYLPPTHPLQQANLARMRDVCGVEPGIAVDGCGVPCFHVPIRAMARAFARVALAMREEDSVLGRIGRAMWARPELVSGTGRLDLAVTRAATERIACKIGAEALFCVALPERGAAVVIKAHTGNGEALAIGVRAVLDAVAPGLLAPEAWPFAEVRNVAGRLVGERVAVWE